MVAPNSGSVKSIVVEVALGAMLGFALACASMESFDSDMAESGGSSSSDRPIGGRSPPTWRGEAAVRR